MARLTIYAKGTTTERCVVEKWECVDKMMGENHIMFTYSAPYPVDFEVGDWCEFRGERYTLNVEPSCTQKAKPGTYAQAFTYESVRMDSAADDLTRCTILDIIPTSGEHRAAYGTNYTGSANFTLNCFETTFSYMGTMIYYAPVHALLDRIKANLDRLYGDPEHHENEWQIYIDDSKCHTDDFVITFNNWTASQALAEVHNTFKLDFVVRGKKILVGDVSGLVSEHPELEGLVGYVTELDAQEDPLMFGYGMGYLSSDNQGKSLFQIKKIAKSDQQIITRLRAMGSTKNMPYRYYHKKYGTAQNAGDLGLPQTMFVQNLQLPDTFVPYDSAEKPGLDYYKTIGNDNRGSSYAHVLGATNDAYIDKGNDAASCPEGIREGTARWDGSDGDLPEIYPTIENGTYLELRDARIPDMDGRTYSSAYPNYVDTERIDTVLYPGSATTDDCNVGDGVLTDGEAFGQTSVTVPVTLQSRTMTLSNWSQEMSLFTISELQERGDYLLSYTTQKAVLRLILNPTFHSTASFKVTYTAGVTISIYEEKSSGGRALVATYTYSESIVRGRGTYASQDTGDFELTLPDFHEQNAQANGWSSSTLHISELSAVSVSLQLTLTMATFICDYPKSEFSFTLSLGKSDESSDVIPNAIWAPSSSAQYVSQTPFHLTIKDIGVDFTEVDSLDGEAMVISMKSGQCAGREFKVKPGGVEVYDIGNNSRKGWTFELDRVVDDSIHAYFPSANNKILAEDQFVLLNIELPDEYIRAAEVRLLRAATDHLADNCETKYTYQPSVDDLYLQRNINFHVNDPEDSVFWRLRSGMKFPFYGIPDDGESPLPMAEITIEQVIIKMGDKPTPQVEITLNNDVEQGMLQKMQITVDRIYGSVFNKSGASGASAISLPFIHQALSKYFLSKVSDDTAGGYITFANGINVQTLAEMAQAIFSGEVSSTTYNDDFTGSGWNIDTEGNATFDTLTVRKTMRMFEMLVQQVRSTGGEIIVSPANGKITKVDYVANQGGSEGPYYKIWLDSGTNGSSSFGNMFQVGDWVRCQRWNQTLGTTAYYWAKVTHVDAASNRINTLAKYFTEESVAPIVGDELVLFGSEVAGRRSVISISAAEGGTPKITVLDGIKGVYNEERGYSYPTLEGCTRVVLGDLSGVTDASMGGALSGYGLYSDNVYLRGAFKMSSGTEIDNAKIVLQADKTTIKNMDGEEIAVFNSDGKLIVHDVESNSVKVFKVLNQYADGQGGYNDRTALVSSLGMGDGLLCYYYDNGIPMKEDSLIFQQKTDNGVLYNQIIGYRTTWYDRNGAVTLIKQWLDGQESTPSIVQYTYTFSWSYNSYIVVEASDPYSELEKIYQKLQDSNGIIVYKQSDIERGKTELDVGGEEMPLSECTAEMENTSTHVTTTNELYNGTLVKGDLHSTHNNRVYEGPNGFSGIVFVTNTAVQTDAVENRYKREYKIYVGGSKREDNSIQWQE